MRFQAALTLALPPLPTMAPANVLPWPKPLPISGNQPATASRAFPSAARGLAKNLMGEAKALTKVLGEIYIPTFTTWPSVTPQNKFWLNILFWLNCPPSRPMIPAKDKVTTKP